MPSNMPQVKAGAGDFVKQMSEHMRAQGLARQPNRMANVKVNTEEEHVKLWYVKHKHLSICALFLGKHGCQFGSSTMLSISFYPRLLS